MKQPLREHEIVMTSESLDAFVPAHSMGTVVHVYPGGQTVEVEFPFYGKPSKVLTVPVSKLDRVGNR